jgi:hypothetical protein
MPLITVYEINVLMRYSKNLLIYIYLLYVYGGPGKDIIATTQKLPDFRSCNVHCGSLLVIFKKDKICDSCCLGIRQNYFRCKIVAKEYSLQNGPTPIILLWT